MTRLNWRRARPMQPAPLTKAEREHERRAQAILSESIFSPTNEGAKIDKAPQGGPIWITTGPLRPDGSLRVYKFKCVEDAWAAGFPWVRR